MQGSLQPGVLPRLLGELYLGGRSGLLRLIKQDESLDCGLREGRIVFARRRDLRDREALLEALSWDEGAYSFEEQPVAPAQSAPILDLSMPDMIREAVQHIEDPDVVSYALGGLDQVLLGIRSGPLLMRPTPIEELVLSQVDGARSVRQVIGLVPLPPEETQRTLLGLLCVGVLQAPGVPESQERPTDPVPPQLSPGKTRPEATSTGPSAAVEAPRREVAGTPEFAATEDLVENALYADDAIRKASHLIAESDYWSAIRLLDAVIPQIHAKKFKHEAQVLLAQAYTKNPKWARRAEELLQVVVREDPGCVHAYFVLGTIYKANGLKTRALAMFRKVVELEPDHPLAATEIAAPDSPAPHRGLFGRT